MWYNIKTHAAIDADWGCDWSINNRPSYLFLSDISKFLTDDRLETILLSDIAWKGKHDPVRYRRVGQRHEMADTKFPGIVAFNAPNPYNDKYRMIDGNHRIYKLTLQNVKESLFYVLNYEEIKDLFVTPSEMKERKNVR